MKVCSCEFNDWSNNCCYDMSNPNQPHFHLPHCTWPTQPSILPGSVNHDQLRLGRKRQVWFIPLLDEMRRVQIKLWDNLRTRAIPERLRGVSTTRRYTNPSSPYLYLHRWGACLWMRTTADHEPHSWWPLTKSANANTAITPRCWWRRTQLTQNHSSSSTHEIKLNVHHEYYGH